MKLTFCLTFVCLTGVTRIMCSVYSKTGSASSPLPSVIRFSFKPPAVSSCLHYHSSNSDWHFPCHNCHRVSKSARNSGILKHRGAIPVLWATIGRWQHSGTVDVDRPYVVKGVCPGRRFLRLLRYIQSQGFCITSVIFSVVHVVRRQKWKSSFHTLMLRA